MSCFRLLQSGFKKYSEAPRCYLYSHFVPQCCSNSIRAVNLTPTLPVVINVNISDHPPHLQGSHSTAVHLPEHSRHQPCQPPQAPHVHHRQSHLKFSRRSTTYRSINLRPLISQDTPSAKPKNWIEMTDTHLNFAKESATALKPKITELETVFRLKREDREKEKKKMEE